MVLPTGNDSGARSVEPSRPSRTYDFPQGFLWGAATASHQVEGNNRWNDWWALEQAGQLPHASAEACRHYELYEHDFDLARDAGHNAHRFSIEWSRVEPRHGEWDRDAVDHYRDVLEALTSRGVEPVVTLQHFTLPAWVADRGGWSNPRSVGWFERYADYVGHALGEGIHYWVTINEPTVYVKHAYVLGDWPPCRRRAWLRASLAFANMARAHKVARKRLRARRPQALVGFAHSAPLIQPCDASHTADRMAAGLRDVVLNRAFFYLLGTGLHREPPFDFIGLNYYTRTIVRGGGAGAILPFAGTECLSDHHTDRGPRSDVGWEVYPDGLLETLRRFSRYGVPLLITENGVATTDENLRSSFLLEHLARLGQALEEGIDVRGYFYWSLMDNYEWALGTTARFGLYAVDFTTQKRTARPVLDLFRPVCDSHRLAVDAATSIAARNLPGAGLGTGLRELP